MQDIQEPKGTVSVQHGQDESRWLEEIAVITTTTATTTAPSLLEEIVRRFGEVVEVRVVVDEKRKMVVGL